MKPKTMMMMLVAVVFGLIASYFVQQAMTAKGEMVEVLVTRNKMPKSTAIKDPALTFESKFILRSDVPPAAFLVANKDDLKNRMTKKNLEKGAFVTQDDVQESSTVGVDARLPPGMRAFALKTSVDSAAGGFVWPGSHVDIIHTTQKGPSTFVLTNVKVLAIDLLTDRAVDKAGMPAATVTLQLKPDQTLRLAKVVATGGPIMLALRSAGDEKEETIEDSSDVAINDQGIPPVNVPAAPDVPGVTDTARKPGLTQDPVIGQKFGDTYIVNGGKWETASYPVNDKGESIGRPHISSGVMSGMEQKAPPARTAEPATTSKDKSED